MMSGNQTFFRENATFSDQFAIIFNYLLKKIVDLNKETPKWICHHLLVHISSPKKVKISRNLTRHEWHSELSFAPGVVAWRLAGMVSCSS